VRAAQFERLCRRLKFAAEAIGYDKEPSEGRPRYRPGIDY